MKNGRKDRKMSENKRMTIDRKNIKNEDKFKLFAGE
jgi:hypothetical protein